MGASDAGLEIRLPGPVEAGALRVRLLGPVAATRNGTSIDVGGKRSQTLLAVLALHPGEAISADRLIDELWSGEPPDGAAITLRTYVSRLRNAFGEPSPIEHLGSGYALRIERDNVDALDFERLAREGDRALERRRHRVAARLFDAALDLWTGEPFGGLAVEGTLRSESLRLGELRLHVVEQRFEALLAMGGASELVDELERLVSEHPYRERLWRDLMLALYRSDRQADALAAFHRARSALDEQLGIEPGEQLAALEGAILRHEVPEPEAAAPATRSTIPAPLTSFVGREAAQRDVAELIGSHRLVTLAGVGGAGKTRLAIEVGRHVADDFSSGAVFVDLAAVSEPGLLVPQVAAAIGLGEGAGSPIDRVAEALRDREMLLILDNCEHLRDATAAMTQRLLQDGPDVRVLATSREVLGVAGEAAYTVTPLQAPDADATPADIRAAEAVRLLLARIARAPADLDEDGLRTAAQICRDLDGLPLAIELAAARTTALTLDEIAARLADRFRFLVSWRRLAPARHQTLREAMDWSFDLLAPPEQRLLAALSVFPGPFTLDGVTEVCLDGDGDAALQLIERLVDASLVVPTDVDGQMRYGLLATVRQYAGERLDPEAAIPLRERLARHVRYRLGLAQALLLAGETDRAISELADIDLDAIADRQLRLQTVLLRGRIQRYAGQISRALADQQRALAWAEDPAIRARVHLRIAWFIERDIGAALGHVDEALWLLGDAGDVDDRAFALALGSMFRLQLGVAADRSAILDALDMGREAEAGEWDVVPIVVSWATGMDDWSLARSVLDASAGSTRTRVDEMRRGHLLRRELEVETWAGSLETAVKLASIAVEHAESSQQAPSVASALSRRGLVRAFVGEVDAAERDGEVALELASGLGILPLRGAAVMALCAAAARREDWARVDALATAMTAELDTAGDVDHTNIRFESDHLDALVALGELDRARQLAARLERKGALGPRASWSGVSERGRAAIAMAEDRLDAAAEHMRRALLQHAPETVPLETAKTLELAAELARRSGHPAAAEAQAAGARAILERLGAAGFNRNATVPA